MEPAAFYRQLILISFCLLTLPPKGTAPTLTICMIWSLRGITRARPLDWDHTRLTWKDIYPEQYFLFLIPSLDTCRTLTVVSQLSQLRPIAQSLSKPKYIAINIDKSCIYACLLGFAQHRNTTHDWHKQWSVLLMHGIVCCSLILRSDFEVKNLRQRIINVP